MLVRSLLVGHPAPLACAPARKSAPSVDATRFTHFDMSLTGTRSAWNEAPSSSETSSDSVPGANSLDPRLANEPLGHHPENACPSGSAIGVQVAPASAERSVPLDDSDTSDAPVEWRSVTYAALTWSS